MESLEKLRALPYDDLVAKYNEKAPWVDPGVELYLREILRREHEGQTASMLRYTRWVTVMTFVMTVATLVNPAVALKWFD